MMDVANLHSALSTGTGLGLYLGRHWPGGLRQLRDGAPD